VLQEDQKAFTLRSLQAGAHYSLDLAEYSGVWYVAVGSDKEDGAYLYKNPQQTPVGVGDQLPLAWRLLQVHNLQTISFSPGSQFVLAESGQQFVLYDAENIRTYQYVAEQPIDQPQTAASWMDGYHLMYTSGGKLVVFDYDHQNVQVLQPTLPSFTPVFDASYKYLYSVAPPAAGATGAALTTTPLTIPKS
jgi:hypothetical protein